MNLIFPELPSPKMYPANFGRDLVRTGPSIGDYRHKTYIAHVRGDADDRAESEV